MSATLNDLSAGQPAQGRRWLAAAAIGVAWILVLVGGLALVGQLPDAEAWALLDFALFAWIALAFLPLIGLSILVRSLRWRVMMRPDTELPPRQTILIYTWIFFIKSLTPLRSGEILRVLWVKKHGGSGAFAAGTILFERGIDLVVIIAMVAAAMVSTWTNPFPVAVLVAAAGVVLIGFAALLALDPLRAWLGRRNVALAPQPSKTLALVGRAARLMDKLLSAFQLMERGRGLASVLAASVVIWLLVGGAYYLALAQFFPELPVFTPLLMILLVNFVSMISASPAGVGSFEAAGVVALASVGVAVDQALPVVIGLHLLILLSSLVWGLAARVALRREIGGAVRLY